MKDLYIELWESIYSDSLDLGMSEEEAVSRADQIAESSFSDYISELWDANYNRYKDMLRCE